MFSSNMLLLVSIEVLLPGMGEQAGLPAAGFGSRGVVVKQDLEYIYMGARRADPNRAAAGVSEAIPGGAHRGSSDCLRCYW